MTKEKPWTIQDEKNLKDWPKMGVTLDSLIFSFEGRYSKNAIYQKMIDLELKEEEATPHQVISSIEMKISSPRSPKHRKRPKNTKCRP